MAAISSRGRWVIKRGPAVFIVGVPACNALCFETDFALKFGMFIISQGDHQK